MKRITVFLGWFFFVSIVPEVLAAPSSFQQTFADVSARAQAKPDDLDLQMDLAYLYTQMNEFERALGLYESVLKKNHENVRALIELCTLYTLMRQRDLAIQTCEKWVQLDGENYQAHDNLGLSHFKFGELIASLKPFTAALALKKDSVLVANHVGQVFLGMGEFAAARDLFRTWLERQGLGLEEKALLYHGLYLAYIGLRQPADARGAIWQTYTLSGNPLYLGKVVSATLRTYQGVLFVVICVLILVICSYFGKRLNRFLKNED